MILEQEVRAILTIAYAEFDDGTMAAYRWPIYSTWVFREHRDGQWRSIEASVNVAKIGAALELSTFKMTVKDVDLYEDSEGLLYPYWYEVRFGQQQGVTPMTEDQYADETNIYGVYDPTTDDEEVTNPTPVIAPHLMQTTQLMNYLMDLVPTITTTEADEVF